MLKHELSFWYKPKCLNNLNKDVNLMMNVVNKTISKELNIRNDLFFDVVIVDNKQIRKINSKFRHIDRITDIITFALRDTHKSIKVNLLGEIYLAPDYIYSNVKDNFKNEFILTYIHGVLHLLSFDHNSKQQRNVMFKLQKIILSKVKF